SRLLDNNDVRILANRCFKTFTKLKTLSLVDNPLVQITASSFYLTPELKEITSTREYLCCIVPATVGYCKPYIEQDAFTTCSDILSHYSLKLFVWVIGCLAFIGNLMVIYIQFFKVTNESEPVPMLLITNLAVSDLIMSIYMLIIGIADIIYHDHYAYNAETWLRSITCGIACFLCCFASLMSVLMMFIISIDRYIYIAFPYSTVKLSPYYAKVLMVISWLFCLIFVCIPTAYGLKTDGNHRLYRYTSICMASNVKNYYYRLWIIVYVSITLVSWLITCSLYAHMFIAIHKTAKATVSTASDSEKRIAIRLFAIIVTDLVSWLPYYFYTIQLLISPTSSGVIVLQFAVILALPINSAINPYLYTLTSPRIIKLIQRRIHNYTYLGRIEPRSDDQTPLRTSGVSELKDTFPRSNGQKLTA
ncbi:G-protein coupled receptor GRL101-like protein, partial [Trichoplax sp. H2]